MYRKARDVEGHLVRVPVPPVAGSPPGEGSRGPVGRGG